MKKKSGRRPTDNRKGQQRGARRGRPVKHNAGDWRQLRARIKRLEHLAIEHPEMAEHVAVSSSKLNGDRWGYFLALAQKWEARARALGLLATDPGDQAAL